MSKFGDLNGHFSRLYSKNLASFVQTVLISNFAMRLHRFDNTGISGTVRKPSLNLIAHILNKTYSRAVKYNKFCALK